MTINSIKIKARRAKSGRKKKFTEFFSISEFIIVKTYQRMMKNFSQERKEFEINSNLDFDPTKHVRVTEKSKISKLKKKNLNI